MGLVNRVLSPDPVASLADYVGRMGGGTALDAARAADPFAVVAELEASGLRGRGGAGFPTGTKWRTVCANASPVLTTTVVVNGAEGEPGTLKDRTILLNNPYGVLEGALVAAAVLGSSDMVIALKRSTPDVVARVRSALAELEGDAWTEGVEVAVFEGPEEYLYGEETAMLEAIDGRQPFPRIAPPYRRGAVEVLETDEDAEAESGVAAPIEFAGAAEEQLAPPALVDNVETFANVPGVVARGADWFRALGTDASPGTIVCTITGAVRHAGVAEIEMGTTLQEAIDEIGGGARANRTLVAVAPGVSNALVPAAKFDTRLTYEDMAAAGSGLGSAGYIVLDDRDDVVGAAAGIARFLAVESCGQCTPCKQDGLALAAILDGIARSTATKRDLDALRARSATVNQGARCNLASQQMVVVDGLLRDWPDVVTGHVARAVPSIAPLLVAETVGINDGEAIVDIRHADKQPDWTYDEEDSGASPADRLAGHRAAG
jgi:NADH-quinone oxidoreductase subunit F